MISAFLNPKDGLMIDPDDINNNSYKIIEASRDGYWTNDDLVLQTDQVLTLFKKLHPNAKALIMFDNSQNHRASAPDALVASRLNLSDGGKNVPKLRNTKWTDVNQVVHDQVMQLPDGTQKGVKRILMERNKWDDTYTLTTAREILSKEPDFASQVCWLEEIVVNKHDQYIIFLPKCHPELNFIEYFWSYVKSVLRSELIETIHRLRKAVPEALMKCPIETIRRYYRHTLRFMSLYRRGIQGGPLADFIMKKYSSHRSIPEELVLEEVEKEYNDYINSKK